MKNIKKQKKSGLCGLYNLVNVLQNKDMLIYEEQEELIPFGHFELNKGE